MSCRRKKALNHFELLCQICQVILVSWIWISQKVIRKSSKLFLNIFFFKSFILTVIFEANTNTLYEREDYSIITHKKVSF